MRDLKYPNLELMEYMFKLSLGKDEEWKKKYEEIKQEKRFTPLEFEVLVFPQLWGATNTAFDVMDDGSAAIGGCAMTKAYTVVFHECTTDVYCVFVDDKPCYMVTEPTEQFHEDLNNRRMESLSRAKKVY